MHRPCHSTRAQHAFTLVEVLVVLSISAILLAVGVPMFNSSIASARASDAANTFKGAIELASSTANGPRGSTVTVCRVTNPGAARPECRPDVVGNYAAGDWAAGWVVFAESDLTPGATVGVLDAGDDILQVQPPLGGGGPHPEILADGGGTVVISFNAQGDRVDGGAADFKVVYPHALAGTAISRRDVEVTIKGQVTVTRP